MPVLPHDLHWGNEHVTLASNGAFLNVIDLPGTGDEQRAKMVEHCVMPSFQLSAPLRQKEQERAVICLGGALLAEVVAQHLMRTPWCIHAAALQQRSRTAHMPACSGYDQLHGATMEFMGTPLCGSALAVMPSLWFVPAVIVLVACVISCYMDTVSYVCRMSCRHGPARARGQPHRALLGDVRARGPTAARA